MNQSSWRQVGLIAAPLLVGMAVALALNQEWLPNRRFQNVLIFDLALLATAAGAAFSLLLALAAALRAWSRRQAQQAVVRAEQGQQQARRDFLKRLDHELKNPLTIMHLGVLNLQQSERLAPLEQESLARIEQQTQRLQKLVVDLRWLADLEEGQIEQALIFENLYRSANARGAPGSGLGLPLVQRIIALHGGQVACAAVPRPAPYSPSGCRWLPNVNESCFNFVTRHCQGVTSRCTAKRPLCYALIQYK